ncbi:PLP-dependent aminotransferase family protein [Mycolicibacterium fluoranthenivorans]|uniref:PLP-dependent aminotransferase family protein n=1 Tax=Mycolicibacterium fluoranthenivorans TaxID=258505 RepID=A0A7G8PLE2_9MYCO|nr:PLP-dependent aminotransferase family protein [Mycolicibacterium fluoranthenivorans]QNJ95158.1 PLP-dependent aminotransferase family protein [Mycolicibacterium fluoranthenivorans]
MPSPRYKTIVDALASDIRAGRLTSGTRLPTHRDLATRERIALATASRVYAELEAMGLVSAEQGRGTFVREVTLPPGHGIDQQVTKSDTIDLNFNYPSVPGQAETLRHALRDLANSGDLETLLRYQPHGGRPHERAIFADHLRRRKLAVDAEHVLIVNGAQHGLTTTMLAALRPGDVVAADALTYPGFKVLAESLHIELAPIPVTPNGPDLDALTRLCTTRRVRAVYAMPTMHNPLSWVMDLDTRRRLVDIAQEHRLLIIEDASYAYLDEKPPPPLAALAPACTVYVSGLSKSVATGLRVGFLAAPTSLIPAMERAIRATTWNTPALTTAIVTRWLHDGTVDRLENEKRADARTRQAIAGEAFGDLALITHPSSYYVWLPLPEPARTDRIAAALLRENISVSTAEPFSISGYVPQAIRLALGSADIDTLGVTMSTVRQAVDAEICR